MATIYDIITITGGYLVSFIACFLLFNWLMSGLLWNFLRVKSSRGQKVLVQVRGKLRDYYRVGEPFENFLVYKGLDKVKRRVQMPKDKKVFFRLMGVDAAMIDEEKSSFVTIDFSTTNGYDATKIDDLFVRCLMRPALLFDNKERFQLLLLLGIAGGVAFLAYVQFTGGNLESQILSKLDKLINLVTPAAG